MIEGGKVDLLSLGEKQGHVVRTVSEHQQRGWLVRYIVVQRFVLVHGIGKFCSWVVVGGGVRKGRRAAGDMPER